VPDPDYPFCVVTDSSAYGYGAALYQVINKEVKYIGFIARTISDVERRWGSFRRELAAVVFVFTKFKQWLRGRKFHLFVDNKSILYIHSKEKVNLAVENWYESIYEMDFDITFCAADKLSRLFIPHDDEKSNSKVIFKKFKHAKTSDEKKKNTQKGLAPLSELKHINENEGEPSRILSDIVPHIEPNDTDLVLQAITRSASKNRADNDLSSIPVVNRKENKVTKAKLQRVVDTIQEQNNVNEGLLKKFTQKEILASDFIIPESSEEREDILIKTHLLGHYGVTAMEKSIHNDNMNWPGLRKDILRTVAVLNHTYRLYI
ncbi:hypothetical protein INT47_002680, partial [Mucor saturninus]